MVRMLAERIDDGALRRLMQKWLKAGVLDTDGQVLHPVTGTPQGGTVSPILAHVFLHYVLDLWCEKGVKQHWRGQACLIRYADDVRHITRRQIPFTERRGSQEKTPGSTAYLKAKAGGDMSLSQKRRRSEGVYDLALQDPRDTVRATRPKPQSPAMEAYIP
jgi:retron-type reverse transcriptase